MEKDIVIALAPGFMQTEVVMKSIELNREAVKSSFGFHSQTLLFVGQVVAKLLQQNHLLDKSGKIFKIAVSRIIWGEYY